MIHLIQDDKIINTKVMYISIKVKGFANLFLHITRSSL